jgi:hypothetical protein
VREAEEEIGLVVTLADLVPLGRRFASGRPGADHADREVQQVFALRSDLTLDAYRLHPHEVASVVSVPLRDALAVFEGRLEAATGLELGRHGDAVVPVEVTVAGFAAGEVGGYPVRALQGLGAVLAGRRPEPFELR